VGGWRKGLLTPETAAARVAPALRSGGRAAVLFGPEDKGLTNDETKVCSRLVTIPTSEEASSLNLAQAVLVILYEMRKAVAAKPGKARRVADEVLEGAADAAPEGAGQAEAAEGPLSESRHTTHQEREALFANLQETLLAIDFLKDDNPDYWMLPVRGFVDRIKLKRSDFNLLMGICRQVKWAVGKGGKK
jgi:tRNA/rRNA methyltransferase